MTIRGVLFDIDDTLFDYSTSEETGVLKHLASEGLLEFFPTPSDAVTLWRRIMEEEYARFLSGELTFPAQRLSRTRRFLSHIGRLPAAGLSDHEAHMWFTRFGTHQEAAWSAFPDAAPVLKELRPPVPPRCRLQLLPGPSATQTERHRPPHLLHRHTPLLRRARHPETRPRHLPRRMRAPRPPAPPGRIRRRQIRDRRPRRTQSRPPRLLARQDRHRDHPTARHHRDPLPERTALDVTRDRLRLRARVIRGG